MGGRKGRRGVECGRVGATSGSGVGGTLSGEGSTNGFTSLVCTVLLFPDGV